MIKLEIGQYDTIAMKHLGAALVAIAAEAGCESPAKDMPHCPVYVEPTEEQIQEKLAAYSAANVPQTPPPPASAALPPAPPAELPPLPVPGAGAGVLDSDGIPWDNRIHAGSKTQCKDGTWKLRPGVDKTVVDQVRAELKGVQAIPAPAAPAAPPAPLTLAPDVAPVVAPPPTPAPSAGPTTFAELIKEVGAAIGAGRLTPDQVNGACQVHGLPTCNLLAGRPDLIPTVWSQLCLILG